MGYCFIINLQCKSISKYKFKKYIIIEKQEIGDDKSLAIVCLLKKSFVRHHLPNEKGILFIVPTSKH